MGKEMLLETVEMIEERGVATIRLNRPEAMNALDMHMVDDLERAVDKIEKTDSLRAVVLTGKGQTFCAGGDVKSLVRDFGAVDIGARRRFLERIYRFLVRFINLEKPVVVGINGPAVGAGLSLAMTGDIMVAAENAWFSQAFAGVGLVPDLSGMYFLPRLVGLARAKEMTLTGKRITAREALGNGLINYVIPAANLEVEVQQMAQSLATGPTKALGLAKRLLNRSMETDLASFLELEAFAQSVSAETEDFREGLNALAEKRPPNFRGC